MLVTRIACGCPSFFSAPLVVYLAWLFEKATYVVLLKEGPEARACYFIDCNLGYRRLGDGSGGFWCFTRQTNTKWPRVDVYMRAV